MKNSETIGNEISLLYQHSARTMLMCLQIEKKGLQTGDMLQLKNEIEAIRDHFNKLAQLWRIDG